MQVTKIEISNIKCFKEATLELSGGINLFVGPNNSGKSTLLSAVSWIQAGLPSINTHQKRSGSNRGSISLKIAGDSDNYLNQKSIDAIRLVLKEDGASEQQMSSGNDNFAFRNIANIEPRAFIYPFLSRRKAATLKDTVNAETVSRIEADMGNLYAKIDRISNPGFQPANQYYLDACENLFGFIVGPDFSAQGKIACYTINNFKNIKLDEMGEGIFAMLSLITNLAVAENMLFIIEEPENDLHPKALKSLLNLIRKSSRNNQFLISTHSNIVARHLGSASDAKIFEVSIEYPERMPTSEIRELSDRPEERRELLKRLGYEYNDVDLWDGWLLLEESSAEKIIKKYLIPWFVSELSTKLRTCAASGRDDVEIRFSDMNRLFVFLHLQQAYKDKAWVIIDGGDVERKIIDDMKEKYVAKAGWQEHCFDQFSEHDFEAYYPEKFANKFNELKRQELSKKQLREEKRKLLTELELWIDQNTDQAKTMFGQSAREVIEKLKVIAAHI